MNPAAIVAVVTALATTIQAVPPALGPIAAAIPREAAILTTMAPAPDDDRDWTRVQRLAPDTEIVLTSRELKAVRLVVVTANDGELVTRRSDALSDVIYRTPRASVVEIRRPRTSQAWRGARYGALTGILAGVAAAALLTSRCRGNCDAGGKVYFFQGFALMFGAAGAAAGAGIGAGVGAASSDTERVIYRAP